MCILSAVLLILSTAGFGMWFMAFFAFVPLLAAVRAGTVNALICGWITGFLYWIVCLSWMITTFTYFGNAPLAASVALLVFISVTAGFLFFAPFAYVAKKYSDPVLLAAVFVALEAVKSSLFFGGVPWLNLAQSQHNAGLILQFVSVAGEYGLSFMIMLINVTLFNALTSRNKKRYAWPLLLSLAVLIAPGVWRTAFPLKHDSLKPIKVVQTGYRQEDKWVPAKRLEIINDLNSRLRKIEPCRFSLVVLPESTYPARMLETPMIMEAIESVSSHTPVIAGTDRKVTDAEGNVTDYYNSMILIRGGEEIQIYDKTHLTPFGEYFPFENLLRPLKNFFFGPGKMFSAGTEPVLLISGDMKIAPLICFESGFTEIVKKSVKEGANLIAVISNDSWFGKNQGRKQHLAVNAVRSAEYGRASAVATQDGISAVILPDGSVPAKITKAVPGEIDYPLPLVSERTLYSRVGYLWLAFVIPFVYYRIKRKENTGA